ncbi:MAG TPA: hypothetical protein VNN18_10985 [Candidatus Xenobia bacterium]|nr:hypothetical protein [Candidatus Xenobia bacterium]
MARTHRIVTTGIGLLASVLLLSVPATSVAQAKPAAKASKPAAKVAAAPKKPERRDPFRSLLVRPGEAGTQVLPPGKPGLVIGQLVVTGIVVMPGDSVAVVSMPGRNRAYFLRERDELYDGYVARITEDSVIFREKSKDAYGRPYEKEVVKQLSASGAKR